MHENVHSLRCYLLYDEDNLLPVHTFNVNIYYFCLLFSCAELGQKVPYNVTYTVLGVVGPLIACLIALTIAAYCFKRRHQQRMDELSHQEAQYRQAHDIRAVPAGDSTLKVGSHQDRLVN